MSRSRRPPAGWKSWIFTHRHSVALVTAITLIAGGALAAVTVVYNSPSTITFQLKQPPIVWAAGPDSSGNNFVASFALSGNSTYFNVTLKPVPEANVTWANFTTLKNQDTAAYTVTVTGDSLSAYAKVLVYRFEFYNYTTDASIGTLNLKDASPSLTLSNMGAGWNYYTKVYVKLDLGTGSQDLPSTSTVSLSIS